MISKIIDIIYINSTTHAQLIKKISTENKIVLFLFENNNLATSFKNFKKDKENNFLVLPKNLILKFIKLFFILLFIKIRKKKILFFFECNNLKFDFLIKIINPEGYFCPFDLGYSKTLYKVDNFLKLKELNIFKKIHYLILSFIFKNDVNFFYRLKKKGIAIYSIMNRYPKNISKIDYNHYLDDTKKIKKRKIIFILQNIINDERYKEFILKFENDFFDLVQYLNEKKIEIHIKNHPNKLNRLNMNFENFYNIDPTIPCELIKDDYFLAIGFGSLPLLNYYHGRSVSLINLYSNFLTETSLIIYKNHFDSWSSHFIVNVSKPENLNQLKNLIEEKLNKL